MKKSPLSTPRGNGGRQSFGWNSGGSPGRGYGRPKNFEYYSPNRSQTPLNQCSSGDYIPFESSTPSSSEKKACGNWQGSGGQQWQGSGGRGGPRRHSTSPGYNNYRDNRPRENQRHSMYYGDTPKTFYGQRKSFPRGGSQRKVDISRYMNLRSFLEDPWAELSKRLSNKCSSSSSLQNHNSLDSSINNTELRRVCLDDSVDEGNVTSTDMSSQEGINDSLVEFENSIVETSQELADVSNCSNSSQDPKPSQDSNDSHD